MSKHDEPCRSAKDKEPAPIAVPAPSSVSAQKPIILVDYEKYAHFLDECDASEEEKREFVQTIWSIIVEFVSLGFGVHPLQQADNPRDNNDKPLSLITPDVLSSMHSQEPTKTKERSDPKRSRVREREES